MLLEGNNVNNYTSQNILTCAQILVHNFIPKTKTYQNVIIVRKEKFQLSPIYHFQFMLP